MTQKLACRVERIVAHGERVYTVALRPERPAPRFRAGQFLHLALDPYDPSRFWPESRVFSIASSPSQRDLLASSCPMCGARRHSLLATCPGPRACPTAVSRIANWRPIPSNVLLFTVTIVPSFAVAALLFLLREGLVEMDVPTRQSYVMAIVKPHERTAVNAITNLVRIVSWALAAAVAGRLMRDVAIQLPLAIAAGMKITYDVLLYRAFRSVRPPEEGGEQTA